MTVIPNGIDVDRFRPCRESGRRLRAEWNVPASSTLVGIVGRLDPMKGHPVFLDAAARLAAGRPNLEFVCVGDGGSAYRAELQESAARLGVAGRVKWTPHVADMPAVYNALDVLCSASIYGEGFPNVVGEAMACGTPCVVTDVGDSGRVLDCSLLTAPPGDAQSLAARLATLLDMPDRQRARLGAEGRRRIVSEYSVARLVDATEHAMVQALTEARR
jgi:glycosyltransferase involved in cell wall biosynthesis